jgi:hypothetical protein
LKSGDIVALSTGLTALLWIQTVLAYYTVIGECVEPGIN